jgi:hypothetical protein
LRIRTTNRCASTAIRFCQIVTNLQYPVYIFYDINKEIENNKKNIKTILNKVNDKQTFLKEMDDYLYKSCDKYINSYEEIDEENDY